MAKSVTVLELSGKALAGVRLEGTKTGFTRTLVGSWPLADSSSDAPQPASDDAAADGGSLSAAAEKAVSDGADAAAGEVVPEDRPLARAFKAASKFFGVREFALALPLSRMLVRNLVVPAEARDDVFAIASSELEAVSPFPDEILKPGVEVVAETDAGLSTSVAALPDATSLDVGEALAAAGVHVTRADVAAWGWLRSLWPQICGEDDMASRLVLFDRDDDGWELVLLANGAPAFMRAVARTGSVAELVREVTLSLLQGDAASASSGDVVEVVVVSSGSVAPELLDALSAFAPARAVAVEDEYGGAEGVAWRIVEGAMMDFTPEAWVEDLAESRFRRKTIAAASAAGAVWLALMGVLFGVDAVYDAMADRQKSMRQAPAHRRAFNEVSAMTNRVALIERYSDRAHCALEILKAVSDNLPVSEAMAFRTFRYTRGDGVRMQGSAGEREELRTFTENLENLTLEGEEEKLFAKVQQMGGENQTKKGIRYSIEALFHSDDQDANGGGR